MLSLGNFLARHGGAKVSVTAITAGFRPTKISLLIVKRPFSLPTQSNALRIVRGLLKRPESGGKGWQWRGKSSAKTPRRPDKSNKEAEAEENPPENLYSKKLDKTSEPIPKVKDLKKDEIRRFFGQAYNQRWRIGGIDRSKINFQINQNSGEDLTIESMGFLSCIL